MHQAFQLQATAEDQEDSLREGPLRAACRDVLKVLRQDLITFDIEDVSAAQDCPDERKPTIQHKSSLALDTIRKRRLRRHMLRVKEMSEQPAKRQHSVSASKEEAAESTKGWSNGSTHETETTVASTTDRSDASTATKGSMRARIAHDARAPPVRYNRLACPRSQPVAVCYVCGKTARLQCRDCRSAFYCGQSHWEHDTNHVVLCDDLRDLQNLLKENEENEDPFRRNILAASVVSKKRECLEKIFYGSVYCMANNRWTTAKYSLEHAIVGVKALRYPGYGAGSARCLELLLLRAVTSCRAGDARQAAMHVSLAEVVLEHSPSLLEAGSTRADVSLVRGTCLMVAGDVDQAKHFLSDSAYWRLMAGDVTPLSIRCMMSLGEIAELQGHRLTAQSFYDHCLQDYLSVLYYYLDQVLVPKEKEFAIDRKKDDFTALFLPMMVEAELTSGLHKLFKVFSSAKDTRQRKAAFALSILCFTKGDFLIAASLLKRCTSQLNRDPIISRYITSMSRMMAGRVWKETGLRKHTRVPMMVAKLKRMGTPQTPQTAQTPQTPQTPRTPLTPKTPLTPLTPQTPQTPLTQQTPLTP